MKITPLTPAQQKLVESCQGLVWTLAQPFARKYRLELDDCVSHANLYLCRGAQKYDPSRGIKFTTYGGHWIRCGLTKWYEANTGTVVRRNTTVSERKRIWRDRPPIDVSIDAPLRCSDVAGLVDSLLRKANFRNVEPSCDEALYEKQKSVLFTRMIGRMHLTHRDKAVIEHRVLGGKTLKETGRNAGVAGDKVRQLEGDLLRRMKRNLKRALRRDYEALRGLE